MKYIIKMIYQYIISINRLKAIGLLSLILLPVSGQLYDDVTLDEELTKDKVINATGTVTFEDGFYSGDHDLTIETGPQYYKKAELTSNKSYIHSIQPRVEISETDMTNLFDGNTGNDPVLYIRDMIEQVSYFDGLGRVRQSIGILDGTKGEDIIGFGNDETYSSEYADYTTLINSGLVNFDGKMAKGCLPYSTIKTDGEANWLPGSHHVDPQTGQTDFYTNTFGSDGNYAYLKSFIASGTGAVKEQGSIGANWQPTDNSGNSNGHTNKVKYTVNTTALNYWHIDGKNQTTYQQMLTGFTLKTGTEAFSPGTITIAEVRDENWQSGNTGGIFRTYTDKKGKTIKKEAVKNDGTVITTHYVYDDLGLLRCIVPPQATSPTETDYCYYFAYSSDNLIVEKKVPGTGVIKYCHDKRGRLVAVQDASQHTDNKWQITKYDYLNRPVLSAIYSTNKTQTELQTEINGYSGNNLFEERGTTVLGYTCRSFPNTLNSEANYLTAIYFDDYNFPDVIAYDASNVDFLTTGDKSTKTKGMITGSKTKILNQGADMPQWLTSVVYYDKYGRIIQTVGENHMWGQDRLSNHLNYAGELLESYTEHSTEHHTTNLQNEYTYDHRGRVLEEYYQVNAEGKIKVKEYEYNELGQIETVYTHMENGETKVDALQTTDYEYNMKGWLTAINDPDNLGNDVFAMKLAYDDLSSLTNSISGKNQYYNGNISCIEWKNMDSSEPLRAYAYTYDKLNRLTEADHGNAGNWSSNSFDLSLVDYDNNGNISYLHRKDNNGSYMDELTYSYTGNKLMIVAEGTSGNQNKGFMPNGNTTTPYSYDANGNMVYEPFKQISIEYNELNLPYHVSYGNDDAYFYYDAAGIKLQVEVQEGAGTNTIDFVGSFVYENHQLAYIATSFGRILNVSGSFDYEYFVTDHLGNIRAVYGENTSGSLQLRQLADYYPFGERFDINYGTTGSDNRYLFNGKELQSYIGSNFNLYDFGARYFDPVLGRWHVVDPVMQYPSPYLGIGNNPINMIDPNGMESTLMRWVKEQWSNFWDNAYEEVVYPMGKAQASIFKLLPAPLRTIGAAQSIGYDLAFDEDVSVWDILTIAFDAIGYGLNNIEFRDVGGRTGPYPDIPHTYNDITLAEYLGVDKYLNWLNGRGGQFISPANVETIDMIYLAGKYNRGVKYSQLTNYGNRVYNETAPKWMERIYNDWIGASTINLYDAKHCNEILNYSNTYYLGDNAMNVTIDAFGDVKDDLNVNLQWEGFDQTYKAGDRISIRKENLNINKVLHRVHGTYICGSSGRKMWDLSKPTMSIDYQIPIR